MTLYVSQLAGQAVHRFASSVEPSEHCRKILLLFYKPQKKKHAKSELQFVTFIQTV